MGFHPHDLHGGGTGDADLPGWLRPVRQSVAGRTGPATNPRGEQMKVMGRARMAGAVVTAAAVIGGGGFALGAVTAEPGRAASPVAAAAQHAGTAQRAGTAGAGYADVVRKVLPSVVLIRTARGL